MSGAKRGELEGAKPPRWGRRPNKFELAKGEPKAAEPFANVRLKIEFAKQIRSGLPRKWAPLKGAHFLGCEELFWAPSGGSKELRIRGGKGPLGPFPTSYLLQNGAEGSILELRSLKSPLKGLFKRRRKARRALLLSSKTEGFRAVRGTPSGGSPNNVRESEFALQIHSINELCSSSKALHVQLLNAMKLHSKAGPRSRKGCGLKAHNFPRHTAVLKAQLQLKARPPRRPRLYEHDLAMIIAKSCVQSPIALAKFCFANESEMSRVVACWSWFGNVSRG